MRGLRWGDQAGRLLPRLNPASLGNAMKALAFFMPPRAMGGIMYHVMGVSMQARISSWIRVMLRSSAHLPWHIVMNLTRLSYIMCSVP